MDHNREAVKCIRDRLKVCLALLDELDEQLPRPDQPSVLDLSLVKLDALHNEIQRRYKAMHDEERPAEHKPTVTE